jgi:hypothetical protein
VNEQSQEFSMWRRAIATGHRPAHQNEGSHTLSSGIV